MTEELRCRLHGLDVRSSIPLHHRRAAASGHDDVVLEWGSPVAETASVPKGRIVAEAVDEQRRLYTIVATVSGHVMRYHGICDFEMDAALAHVTCRPSAGGDRSLVPVLASGGLFAAMLMLRGDLVLHASAAIAGTGAIAFVGDSGMGKSTLATLLALAGAPLLTDDVLRVGPGPEFAVYAGATETRLRDGAIAMVEGGTTVRGTADGRTAVSFGVAGGDSVRLACVVVPFPARDIAALRATRLTARDALVLLVRFPRVLGWRDRATAAQQFGQLADLVEAVPVFTASVPWGPPFPEGLAPDLLSLVE